jgi:hypothetical protein
MRVEQAIYRLRQQGLQVRKARLIDREEGD